MNDMLWVDCDQYYGPDRRRVRGKRMLDRRRIACGANPPAMNTALLQLRMRTLDAQGAGLPRYIARLRGAALLAKFKGEIAVMNELLSLAAQVQAYRGNDISGVVNKGLDRAQANLNDTYRL